MTRGAAMTARAWVGAALLLLGGAARAQEYNLAARVNGRPITLQRLDRYFEDHAAQKGRNPAGIWNPDAFKKLKREALDKLVEEELLWQEAERRKTVATPEEAESAVASFRSTFRTPQAFKSRLDRGGFTEQSYAEYVRRQISIKKLLDQEVAAARITVSDEEMRAHYDSRPDLFVEPEQVHVRHILVKAEAGTAPAVRAKARQKAERLLALARKKGADFAALARKHSEDATAPGGGDLGFISRAQMVKPFEEAAFALQPGQVSGVVESFYGFHVIKAEERRGGGRIPEPEAREQIRKTLFGEKAQKVLQDMLARLQAAGRVEILVSL